MNLEAFVTAYGYPALAIGTLLEGGAVGMFAGGLAYRGYLHLPWVITVIFGCAFGADQFFFQVGKRWGKNLLERKPTWEPRVDKVHRFLITYQVLAVLGFRFIYGMRTITPIVIGASGFNTRRFLLLNCGSTFVWATVVGSTGYFFGHMLQILLADARRHMVTITLVMLFVGYLILLWHRYAKEKL